MPRIGLLSDSHGRAEVTRRAVEILADQGARVLIHLGDIETTAVIDQLVVDGATTKKVIDSYLVFGNVDWDLGDLGRYAADLNIRVEHPVGRIELPDGRAFVFTHGDNAKLMQQALEQQVAYLCHGHTHLAQDECIRSTRVINPGALSRAAQYSVALIDTESDGLTFYPVAKS